MCGQNVHTIGSHELTLNDVVAVFIPQRYFTIKGTHAAVLLLNIVARAVTPKGHACDHVIIHGPSSMSDISESASIAKRIRKA